MSISVRECVGQSLICCQIWLQDMFVELYGLIGMSCMKIFGNASSIFNLAVEILMSSVLVEFSIKSFVVSQLCKSVRQFCSWSEDSMLECNSISSA